MSVFKAYDIRGIVPTDINPRITRDIGRAFGTLLRREGGGTPARVMAAHDMRISFPELYDALMEGMRETGCTVTGAGLMATPVFYYAVATGGYDGGVVVTASHNPKEYNGFKLVRRGGRPLGKGTGMEELRAMFEKKDFDTNGAGVGAPIAPGMGLQGSDACAALVEENIREWGTERIAAWKQFTVVADAANAMGGTYLSVLFERLAGICGGLRFLPINFSLDGTFPAHEADPLKPENCTELAAAIRETGADLGIATDGDGDRIFFLDNTGAIVPPAVMSGLLAEYMLKKHPGGAVCVEPRPGKIAHDMIRAAGGTLVETPVGHSIIKAVAEREECVCAGELSGHFFVRRPYGFFEDPICMVLLFLDRLAEAGVPASEFAGRYKRYAHSGEISFTVTDTLAALERIRAHYANGDVSLLDGVSVTFPTVWFNVRASNTEPLMRLNVEGTDPDTVAHYVKEISALITRAA